MLPAFIAEVQSGAFDSAREAIRARLDAPTFREATDAYLTDYMRQDADGASTRKAYGNAFSAVANELGEIRIGHITEPMLHKALRTLHRSGRAIATIKLAHAALSVFFKRMVKLGLIPASPLPRFADLALGRGEQASERVRRSALSKGQIAALLEACRADDALRVWITVMVTTGARPGEALALRWQDVDLQRGVLHIEHSVKDGGGLGQGRLGSTKTRGSVRTVPMGPGLVAAIATERTRQETLLRRLRGLPANVAPVRPILGPEDCVFSAGWDDRSIPPSLHGMRARFKTVAARAGLSASVTPHYLRHTAITAMVAGDATRPGISVIEAARLAGHSDPGTTSRTYAHAVQANLQRGIALADDLITPNASAVVEHLPNAADV